MVGEAPRSAVDEWSAFLWAAWGALGVSSWQRRPPRAVIDPEALVVLTELFGDLRLERETIDWGILHAHLLSPTRLRSLAVRVGAADDVETWIATTAAHARRARWRSDGHTLEGFRASGKSRSVFEGRQQRGATLTLRHRAIIGSGARGEVIRGFHPVLHGLEGPRSTSEIATAAAATTAQVGPLLDDLVSAGIVDATTARRGRRFFPREDTPLARGIWEPWHAARSAPWVEAVELYPLLARLLRLGTEGSADPADVAAGLNALAMHERLLATATGLDATRPGPGRSQDVARDLVALAEEALGRLTSRLDEGRPTRRDAAVPAQPWSKITWTTRV